MAVKHNWSTEDYAADCLVHVGTIDGTSAHPHEIFNLDNEQGNGGGGWVVGSKGGITYWRKQTISAAGNGHLQRADAIINDDPWGTYRDENGNPGITALTRGLKGETTTYRWKFFADLGSGEYKYAPGTNWNAIGMEFHSSFGGWPGQTGPCLNYLDNVSDYIRAEVWSSGEPFPFHAASWQAGDLFMSLFGGNYAAGQINAENRVFLPKGQWEGKVIDFAIRVHWNDNAGQPGAYGWNRFAPADLANSGWVELQYRLGTVSGGTITWGSWQWFDPVYQPVGHNFNWTNGPEPHRHYYPTLAVNEKAYQKMPNYRGDTGSSNIPSSVWYFGYRIDDTFTDSGAPEPTGVSPGDTIAPSITNATVNGTALQLVYDEAFDPASVPAAGDFVVKVNGTTRTLTGSPTLSGNQVNMVLSSAVIQTDTVTISYTPGTNKLKDTAGNTSVALTNRAVTNGTPPSGGTALFFGKKTVGASSNGTLMDTKRGNKYLWDSFAFGLNKIQLASLFTRVKGGTGTTDVGNLRYAVYALDGPGGSYGTLLATYDPITLTGSDAPAWRQCSGSGAVGVQITKAQAGLGLGIVEQYGASIHNIAWTFRDVVTGVSTLRGDTYSDGISNPFTASAGSPDDGDYDDQFSFYVEFTDVSTGTPVVQRLNTPRVINAAQRIVGSGHSTVGGGGV